MSQFSPRFRSLSGGKRSMNKEIGLMPCPTCFQVTGAAIGKEALPGLSRLAIMWGPNNASVVQKFKQAQAAAAVLQIPTQSLEVRVAEDIERSFTLAAEFGAEAV